MSRGTHTAYPRSWWLCMWAALLAALVITLTGCGGGAASDDEVAAHDAEHTKSVQPVACPAPCRQ